MAELNPIISQQIWKKHHPRWKNLELFTGRHYQGTPGKHIRSDLGVLCLEAKLTSSNLKNWASFTLYRMFPTNRQNKKFHICPTASKMALLKCDGHVKTASVKDFSSMTAMSITARYRYDETRLLWILNWQKCIH